MRFASITLLASSLVLGVAVSSRCQAAPADGLDMTGSWKLVVLFFGEDEFLLINAKTENGKLTAQIKDAQQQVLPRASVTKIEQQGDRVKLEVSSQAGDTPFTGTLGKNGAKSVRFLGTYRFRDSVFPARLEKTEATKVAALVPGSIPGKVGEIRGEKDPKARLEKLKALLAEHPDTPANFHIHYPLLQAAVEAGQIDEFRADLKQWIAEAKPYGDAWSAEVWLNVLRNLAGKKPHEELMLELASEADKSLGDDLTIEQRAAVVHHLAEAAKATGKAQLASAAEARSIKLEAQLDDQFRAKVPPFKPEAFAGRKDAKSDRVVLMELFTGAQCPPCVAADVAFDALLKTYKPSELVALQYHEHIPGPDPLTNSDTEYRADYYQIRSAPSSFFNGKLDAQGGGPMGLSEPKYGQYRQIIEAALEGKKQASIELGVKRSGDEIHITASAQANPEAVAKKQANGAKGDEKSQGAKPKLRLALVEESIRYVGGNKMRFHHHVVRALPGGAEGKELTSGRCQTEVTVSLAQVRKGLEEYVSDFEKSRGFPNPLPPIELKDLAVVAFVQDDADQSVWHAVVVPVREAN